MFSGFFVFLFFLFFSEREREERSFKRESGNRSFGERDVVVVIIITTPAPVHTQSDSFMDRRSAADVNPSDSSLFAQAYADVIIE